MIPELEAMTPADWERAKKQMKPAEFEELVAIFERERWLDERRKLYGYYPDTGPLRRELYPKHLEFFAAGKVHQERAVIAANRCITPWTAIETAGSSRQFRELLGETSFDVRGWADGSGCGARASAVFLKGIEPAFRLHLDTGDSFDCSGRHRVLTTAGYIEVAQLAHASDGLHCWRTTPDYPASYGGGDRPCDAPPQADPDTDQASPREAGGARRPRRISEHWDGAGHTPRYSRSYRGAGRDASLDDHDLIADLCAMFPDPGPRIDAEWSSHERQELQRFATEFAREQGDAAGQPRRSLSSVRHGATASVPLQADASHTKAERDPISRDGSLAHCRSPRGTEKLQFLHEARGKVIFVASSSPMLVGGQRLQSIVPLGCQPILDATVPGVHNYCAAGVIHHNTGKSFLLGYEDTCHMTGWYPKWWEGRRFNRPIITWIAGEDAKAVRESMQFSLLGPPNALGTGTIPFELIVGKPTAKSGVPEAYDAFAVKHASGGVSRGLFKAYDQGRESFQAAQVDVIVLDEEPDKAIYTESLTRTMSTKPGEPNGIVMCGFTPLKGLSEVVLMYLPGGRVAKPA